MSDPAVLPHNGDDVGEVPCTGQAVPRADLGELEREELHSLLVRHFDGVSREQFSADLDGKDWVLRIRRGDRLIGFSTMKVYESRFESRMLNVVFSGDTIVDPEAWRSPVLAREWIALVRRLQAGRQDEPWYWLLISSGWRTYRFLPVFWREFHPRYDAPTPPTVARLLCHLGTERFGDRFDPTTGVVRFEHPQVLRGRLAEVPEGRSNCPHVRFFQERNPGHEQGDELVCVTDLSDGNLTRAGARMVRGL